MKVLLAYYKQILYSGPMIVSRLLEIPARNLFEKYPVLTVTGPRQSGKTTLCRRAFPDLDYVSLESPDQREFATRDPRGFLGRLKRGAILDEIQRAPELVSYIQEIVDESRRNSLFVLTGSRQFRVSEAISQSLAGRTGIFRLLPFSIGEAAQLQPEMDTDSMLYKGFYPRIYDQDLNPTQALGDYFETYVERDVRQVSEIRHLSAFHTFVRLCAGRVGQLLNLQGLGNDAGVSHTTAREWLSVLEASYLVFVLPPLHANISKRLIKSPKMYFFDVGLASYLLGIENKNQIFTHPLKGALFENLVVVEALKHRYNRGLRSHLTFYRDSSGNEVDLVCSFADRHVGIEVKAGATVSSSFFDGLERLSKALPQPLSSRMLVHGGDQEFMREGVIVTNPRGFASRLLEVEQSFQASDS
ncbi:MAG: ATP-binding protein [Acidobacteriota bacterium]